MANSLQDITWKEVVRDALVELGGEGHLDEINRIVRTHPKTKTNPTWKFTIRRVVRQYSIFQPVPPNRSGVYRLVEQPHVDAEPQSLTGQGPVDHGEAQGMLLALGRMYGYETFAPATDRTTRTFQGQSLADFSTVADCADFCGKNSLARVRQIDAMWLAEDNDGVYPVHAFEVEHTTGVRSGMDRLIELPERLPVKLFVVAPGKEEQATFEKLIRLNRFRKFRDRLYFVTMLNSTNSTILRSNIQKTPARLVFPTAKPSLIENHARKIWVSVLIMKRASESGWPELRKFWMAASRVGARVEKITLRFWRPMKIVAGFLLDELELGSHFIGIGLGAAAKRRPPRKAAATFGEERV